MFDIESWVYRNYDVVSEYGHPVTDLRVDCHNCDDMKQHLHISLVKKTCHCFRCEYSASWVKLVMDVQQCPYHIAIGELYVRPKAKEWKSIIMKEDKHEEETDISLPKDFVLLHETKLYVNVKKYLKKRGFPRPYWEMYSLGASDAYSERVIIPIEQGLWQGRAIWSWMEPKYINPKHKAGHHIFNSIALEMYDEVVICEGAFSAMAVAENAVALIGKGTYEKRVRLIDSKVEHFIIAMEADAKKQMLELADALYHGGKYVTIWAYDPGKDPADTDKYLELPYNLKSKVSIMLGQV